MHEHLDSIPRRAGKWHSKHIYFPDQPDQPFVLIHRDILEAIKALWGDPALAEYLEYKPKRMFTDENKETRMYTEMWTGEWWWLVQVRLERHRIYITLTYNPGSTPAGNHNCVADCVDRQDTTYPILRRSTGISSLSHARQHPTRHSTQAIRASLHPHWLSSR